MAEAYVHDTIRVYNGGWERFVTNTGDMVMHQELRHFFDLIPNQQEPVLDAGCAYGRDAAALAELGLDVVGVDMSEAFLAEASRRYPHIPVGKMDVCQLGFPDQLFGGIWCNAVLLHLNNADIARALNEFQRVLIPGGALLVSFKEGGEQREFIEPPADGGARYYNYKTMGEVGGLLTAAGFTAREGYLFNEREFYNDPTKRDVNWVYYFATKRPAGQVLE